MRTRKQRSVAGAAAVLTTALVLAAAPATAKQPGGLDTTFNGDGTYVVDDDTLSLHDVAIDAQGRIVLAGGTYASGCTTVGCGSGRPTVRRLLANGQPDPTFNGGQPYLAPYPYDNDFIRAVALDGNGRILVLSIPVGYQDDELRLTRVLSNGSPDPSFGALGQGYVRFSWPEFGGIHWNVDDVDGGLTVDKKNRPVVVGTAERGSHPSQLVVARRTESGEADTTFSGDGFVSPNLPGNGAAEGADVAIVKNRIIAVGSYKSRGLLVGLTSDGSKFTAFGNNSFVTGLSYGKGRTKSAGVARIAVDGKSRIVVAGHQFDGKVVDWGVARFNKLGKPDTAFGDHGSVATRFKSGGKAIDVADGIGLALAVDGKDRVVVAGNAKDLPVARYRTNGKLDPSFDGDGKRIVGVLEDQTYTAALGMAIDGQNRPVVVGTGDRIASGTQIFAAFAVRFLS